MTARTHSHTNSRLAAVALIAAGISAAATGMILPTAARAQMPPDIAAKIATLGRVVDPENIGKLYAPLQEKEPYAGIKVLRDVKYRPDARNALETNWAGKAG
jgi:hypothetical protein